MIIISGPSRGRAVSYTASGGGGSSTDLLTLNSGLSGTAGYKYLNWSAAYQGAFRLPGGDFGSETANDLNYTDNATIGMGSSNTKLFVAGRDTGGTKNVRTFAEFNIPTLSTSGTLTSLNIASNAQVFRDVLTSPPSVTTSWSEGRVIGGLYTINGMVVVSAYGYYTSTDTPLVVVDNASSITTANLRGYFDITGRQQYGGWITPIPSAHQSALGGTHLIGYSMASDRAILTKYSLGPSAAVIDLSGITSGSPPSNGSTVSITPKLNYANPNGLTPELNLGDSGTQWTFLSGCEIGLIVPGTRTLMMIGTSGGHSSGSTYWDPTPPWGDYKGYGPNTQSDKYNYYWLYDLDTITSATNIYDPDPYEQGSLSVQWDNGPGDMLLHKISGATYDPSTGKLYMSLNRADNSQVGVTSESALPLIVCYSLSSVA